jgi:dipeptidyl aminopeptidase/acylaminoacyl peptidase
MCIASRSCVLLPVLAVFVVPGLVAAQQQGRAFTPADWYRVVTVSNPAISPDGRQVAFTVTRVIEADNRRHSEVWVVRTDGGEPVRYTSPTVSSSSPRWSPDGRLLLFQSTRPGSRARTWALRMDRPGGEAFEYDSLPTGSLTANRRTIAWSEPAPADTGRGRGTDPFGRMQPAARPPFGAVTRPLDPARFDGRHYVDLPIKSNGQGYLANRSEARQWRPTQIWVQELTPLDGPDGRPYAITRRQVTSAAYSHGNVTISPDGRWIAFTADARLRPDSVVAAERDSLAILPYDPVRDEAPRNDSDVWVIPAAGGEPRRVIELMGTESNLEWSPDGRHLAFVHREHRTAQARLLMVPVTGGQPVVLTRDWRYEPGDYVWLPDGTIRMEAQIGGRTAVYRVDPRRGTMQEVLGGRRRLSGITFDAAGRLMAFVASSVTQPTELFVAGTDGRDERKLTGFNDALNREIAWSDAEVFTYPSVGGLEIEGWLMKPYGYEPGRKYPLVLYIHGGPHSLYGENWFDEFQNLAGAGMWVLYTNPRGSSGYGAEFTYATRGRWFAEDYEDLMRAVDLVARRPDVDSTRMGVTGGSYGGVMTAWVTVKTNRFKAAQTDRMISNWWSWYGSSDAQGLTEFEFYGKPWDNPALYDSLSPIRYIRQVRTPTLIVQSEEDHRTPMTDAEQWFTALRKHGVPVEFVRYPRSNHDLSRTGEPWLLVDRLARLRQWFGWWLGVEPPRVQASGPTDPSGEPKL